MEPVEADVDDVLEDVAEAVSGLSTGRVQVCRSEVRRTEEITYLVPGSWQDINDSLLALHQSLAPLEGGLAPGEIPATGGPVGALKRFVKRMIQKSVYWYVNPVVEQLHRTHAAADRALSGIARQLESLAARLEEVEEGDLEGRISALEERIDRLERAAGKNRETDD